MSEKSRAVGAARILEDKKAKDVVLLEVGKHTVVTDYFVIATALNHAHMPALADALEGDLGRPRHREGDRNANWLLLDYGSMVVHLFIEEARQFYDLERLWGDAPSLSIGVP